MQNGKIMNCSKLENILSKIKLVDKKVAMKARKKLDLLAIPNRSLGVLEECAEKYVTACDNIDAKIHKPTILTFAGDHGVAEEGVSAFPQSVTQEMVKNFVTGGASISVLANYANAELKVIDVGVAGDCPYEDVINKKVAYGTNNIALGPAMTIEQTEAAICAGIDVAETAICAGSTLLGTGDMGIANTTPSAAIYAAFTNLKPQEIAGRGTGIDDIVYKKKIEIIEKALEVNKNLLTSPLSILSAVGGYEIAGICGAILAACANKTPIVIDGFISSAAAICAINFDKNVLDYCFFSHLSAEAGHKKILSELGVRPLLDLNLRLGEGTGAALAFNIIGAGVEIFNKVASFEDAGVSTSGSELYE